MISSVKYFRMITVSFFLFLIFCGREEVEKAQIYQKDIVIDYKSDYYEDDVKVYSLTSDTGYYIDSLKKYVLKNIEYTREDGENVKIFADSSYVYDKSIEYFGNVKILFSDSMVLYTKFLHYNIESDTLKTQDSIMIEKKNDRMLTKGFVCFDNFKKTVFLSPVLIYDEKD
ncbi:MAG: LPS export ABC transporter periplasmic protein LptC [candidate division WOR-3 bacterium]